MRPLIAGGLGGWLAYHASRILFAPQLQLLTGVRFTEAATWGSDPLMRPTELLTLTAAAGGEEFLKLLAVFCIVSWLARTTATKNLAATWPGDPDPHPAEGAPLPSRTAAGAAGRSAPGRPDAVPGGNGNPVGVHIGVGFGVALGFAAAESWPWLDRWSARADLSIEMVARLAAGRGVALIGHVLGTVSALRFIGRPIQSGDPVTKPDGPVARRETDVSRRRAGVSAPSWRAPARRSCGSPWRQRGTSDVVSVGRPSEASGGDQEGAHVTSVSSRVTVESAAGSAGQGIAEPAVGSGGRPSAGLREGHGAAQAPTTGRDPDARHHRVGSPETAAARAVARAGAALAFATVGHLLFNAAAIWPRTGIIAAAVAWAAAAAWIVLGDRPIPIPGQVLW